MSNMTERINISYHRENPYQYLFLKAFFNACGTWAVGKAGAECGMGLTEITVIGKNRFGSFEEKDKFYVTMDSTIESEGTIAVNDVEGCQEVVARAFQGTGEEEDMKALLKLFADCKLWRAVRLFEDRDIEKEERQEEVIALCKKALDAIDASPDKGHYRYRYLSIYCKYMMYGSEGLNQFEQSDRCKPLLTDIHCLCKDSEEHGWTFASQILDGDIGLLIREEERLSYFKWEHVMDKKDILGALGHDAETMCKIARIYDVCYGEKSKSDARYMISKVHDPLYIPTMYHNARIIEHAKQIRLGWMKGLQTYERLRNEVRKLPVVTREEARYDYLALRKIYFLYRSNINSNDTIYKLEEELANYVPREPFAPETGIPSL